MSSLRPSPASVAPPLVLDTPVQFVRGVGPGRAKLLETLGIRTVAELIEHYPFRYEVTPKSQPIGTLRLGQRATVVGALTSVRTGGAASVLAQVVDATGKLRATWFNAPYVQERLRRGETVRLSGTVESYRDTAEFHNPDLTVIEHGADPFANDVDRFEPIYPAVAGLPTRQLAAIIRTVLAQSAGLLTDIIPHELRRRRKLPPRPTAIQRYHRPTSAADAEVARRRLAYDELLLVQLAVQLRRQQRRAQATAPLIAVSAEIDRRIRARLPFALTPGQDQAVAEITADLARRQPMHRLLQADVGAGKTAVAIYAALAAIARKRQVALMAPTEILAEQHHAKVQQYLAGSLVRIGYLVGGQSKSVREQTLRGVASGEVDLVIGTHALLEENVKFAALGLVVIDEQHRFGVYQRSAILGKTGGQPAHYLVMTATPIPRTLALTLFGDLDVSIIRDGPPGRQPIVTRILPAARLEEAWAFVRQRLAAGERAYIVYPLVEESEESASAGLTAATAEYERLRRGTFAGVGVELLHGRMKPADKAAAMERFRSGQSQVLVATTVIEVGIDVPGATIMVVQHAERYGLSQLHQLRGRIGRGDRKSYCILVDHSTAIADCRLQIADLAEGTKAHLPSSPRLQIMGRTNDGFRIAEEDLRLRGPGEVLGARQHGLPTLKAANLLTDLNLLDCAREDAAMIVGTDARLTAPRHAPLRAAVIARFGEAAALVG